MREREGRGVDVDRRTETGARAADVAPIDPPAGCADEQSVDRQAVVVGPQRQTLEVDGDAAGAVPARGQAVRPRGEQREPARAAGPQVVDATREGEVLATPNAQRHPGHADGREERRRQLAGLQGDPRLASKSALPRSHDHRGHATRDVPSGAAASRERTLRFEEGVHHRHRDRSLADGGGHALDVAGADVASGEDAGDTGLQGVR